MIALINRMRHRKILTEYIYYFKDFNNIIIFVCY